MEVCSLGQNFCKLNLILIKGYTSMAAEARMTEKSKKSHTGASVEQAQDNSNQKSWAFML